VPAFACLTEDVVIEDEALTVVLPARPERRYEIRFGEGFDENFTGFFSHRRYSKIFVITEESLREIVYEPLYAALRSTGLEIHPVFRPSGESTKHISHLEGLFDGIIRAGADRASLVIAAGGGVVGDLAGFVAATLLRGVPFVQVPSTLLAMVDSSVGGKVAVNVNAGKNMVGAFYQPEFVYGNLHYLSTLPPREWICGLAEMAKHAFLTERSEIFDRLLETARQALKHEGGFRSLPLSILKKRIQESVSVKASVVAADETEKGLRASLNLGHTTAHAIESLLQYRGMTHGEAVSRGLVTALLLSRELQGLPEEECETMLELMQGLQLPLDTAGFEATDLLEHMKFDKKNEAGTIRFVLLKRRGKPVWGVPLSAQAFRRAWAEQRARFG
jgi:3-dehydroquinate synthase